MSQAKVNEDLGLPAGKTQLGHPVQHGVNGGQGLVLAALQVLGTLREGDEGTLASFQLDQALLLQEAVDMADRA